MYKIFLIFFVGFLSAQQKCQLSFSSGSALQDGSIIFGIQNIGVGKVKVPVLFNSDFARPIDLQVYNEDVKDYVDTKYSFDGALCGDVKICFGKIACLRKNESKQYEVNIVPGRISKAFKEGKKYRFKLSFDTYLFSSCDDFVTTDWLYYQN